MSCPKCCAEMVQVNFTARWCSRCGTLVSGTRDKFLVREPSLRELLAVRLNRGEMSLMLERQIREQLYGAQRPAPVAPPACTLWDSQDARDYRG